MKSALLKPTLLATAALTMALSGCTTTSGASTTTTDAVSTASSLGMSVLQTAVDSKCHSELDDNQIWSVAKLALSETQQQNIEDNVCSCVSENAAEDVTMTQLAQAAIDSSYRTQVVAQVVSNSLQSCYTEFMN